MADKCGLYEIVNERAGKRYVGSSCRVRRRFNDHKFLLRRNSHGNIHLQRAWNRDGENAFRFTVLDELPVEQLFPGEQHLLDEAAAKKEPLYNIATDAEAAMRGKKASPETRVRLSAALKIRFSDPAARSQVAAAMTRALADPEIRKAMSARRAKEWADPVIRERRLAAYRKAMASSETRARISAAGIRRFSDPAKRLLVRPSAGVLRRIAEKAKARWADPVKRAAYLAATRSPEVRKKLSDHMKARWAAADARAVIERALGRCSAAIT